MFELGLWLHIAFGFALGVFTIIFVLRIAKLQKLGERGSAIFGTLMLFSILISYLSYMYQTAISGEVLEEWQLLGFPSINERAIEVLEIGYVQTQAGNIYRFSCSNCGEGQWEKVDKVSSDSEEILVHAGSCGTMSFLPVLRKDFIDVKEDCMSWGPGLSKIAYAIDNGGRVYYWWNGVGEYSGFESLRFLFYGGLYSCGFGIFIAFFLPAWNYLRVRQKSKPI